MEENKSDDQVVTGGMDNPGPPAQPQNMAANMMGGLAGRVKGVGKAGMYSLEYFLLLLHVYIGLFLVLGLFNKVLDDWTGKEVSGWLADSEFAVIVGMISATVVVFPLLTFFFQRVVAAEREDESLISGKWRRNWQNIFLAVIFVWALTTFINWITQLIHAMLSVSDVDGNESLWLLTARTLFTVAILALAGWHFYESHAKNDTQHRRYIVINSGLGAILLVLTAIFPLTEQRNVQIDKLITKDLAAIEDQIQDYVTDERELPTNLSDVDLDEDVEARSSKYNYEYSRSSSSSFSYNYELCADFKTDTSDKDDDEPGYNFFDALSGNYSYPSSRTDFGTHDSGRYCFDLSATNYNPYSPSIYDYYNGGSSGSGLDSSSDSEDYSSLFENLQ
jgi:hypothetical protein